MLKDVFYTQTGDVKVVSFINVTVQTNMTSDYPDLNVSFQVTMVKYLLPIFSVFNFWLHTIYPVAEKIVQRNIFLDSVIKNTLILLTLSDGIEVWLCRIGIWFWLPSPWQ